jgi:peroxiredoxin
MNLPQNMNVPQRNEFNAGGMVHVPPTCCLPPVCASAHVPAYVELTGKAVTNKSDDMWTVSPVTGNGLILFSELRL